MAELKIRNDDCALDFLSLGSLVHRLDPGRIPFRKARSVTIHVSGGEYNVAANLADCFGLKTGIFRAGCITGAAHAGVELHGFLAYLVRASLQRQDVFLVPGRESSLPADLQGHRGLALPREALLKIYSRLRPGNPPQLDKARELFHEKFFDDNRYRLGRVGTWRGSIRSAPSTVTRMGRSSSGQSRPPIPC